MDLAGSTVAVTGASGCIGRHLVRSLLGRGAHVVAVVRNPDKVPQLRADGIEIRKADLKDRESLTAAFRGVDAVFSNAGLIGIGGQSKQDLIANNVEGTRNVYYAMVDAGVERVVMTSSAEAYRPRKDKTYTEDADLRDVDDKVSRFSWYGLSKGVAEREAWRISNEEGLKMSSFRPHFVYGAFDDHGGTAWLKKLNRGPIGVWLAGFRIPVVYAGDLGEAACAMLERDVSIGRAYNLGTDPGKHTAWELLRAYKEAGASVSPLIIPLPAPFSLVFPNDRAKADLAFVNRSFVDGCAEILDLESRNAL